MNDIDILRDKRNYSRRSVDKETRKIKRKYEIQKFEKLDKNGGRNSLELRGLRGNIVSIVREKFISQLNK